MEMKKKFISWKSCIQFYKSSSLRSAIATFNVKKLRVLDICSFFLSVRAAVHFLAILSLRGDMSLVINNLIALSITILTLNDIYTTLSGVQSLTVVIGLFRND